MRIKYTTLAAALLLTVNVAMAQKPDKVFSNQVFAAMDATAPAEIDEKMNEAKADFQKVLLKDTANAMAQMGLAIVFSHDAYTGRDYFEAWRYFQKAETNQNKFTDDDKLVLNELFFKQDKKRRGRPLDQNMEWEKQQIEEKLIKFVREENNLEYAKKFLKEFPDSKYHTNVVHIRNYIEYRTAENTNTVAAYNNFIKSYPDAAQIPLATEARNKLAFEAAKTANTIGAFQQFLADYPNAAEVEEAKKIVSILAFDVAAKSADIEALDNFMRQYPNSPKMPDAKLLKRQLLFEWAKKVNTLEAYNTFVTIYPEGEQYIDIFNLKSKAMGEKLMMDFPMDNYVFMRGFDNHQYNDAGGSVALMPDGKVLLVTNSPRDSQQITDNWVMMLKPDGTMGWNKFLGNPLYDKANAVEVNASSEIFVAGSTNKVNDTTLGKAWLYKLSADGTNLYNRIYDGSELLTLSLYQTGEALVGGYTKLADTAPKTSLLIKVNANGKKLWDRTFLSSKCIYQVATDANQNAYIAGGNWVAAIDKNGYILWDKTLEPDQNMTSVCLNPEGNVCFGGTKANQGALLVLSAKGEQLNASSVNIPNAEPFVIVNIMSLDKGLVLWSDTRTMFIATLVSKNGELIANKQYNLPNGCVMLNGVAKTGPNQMVVSATHQAKPNDIVVFDVKF